MAEKPFDIRTQSYTLTATLALIGFYTYAIPGVLTGTPVISPQIAKWLYGAFGSLWWLVCGILLLVSIRAKPDSVAVR